jgi:peptide/nickel transport system substrate-binding protein
MKLNKILSLVLVLCLFTAPALADITMAGDGQPAKDGGVPGGTFIIQNGGDPTYWAPDYRSDDNLWAIAQNVFNRLIKLAAGDGLDYDLAYAYEFSEDGMDLTFHLHDNVKWHDGVPFTSADVKWTYDTIIANSWSRVTSLESIDSIECPDDYTVVMHLKAPDVTIIPKLGWYDTFILPAHIFEGAEDVEALFTKESSMIGTGPYKFDSHQTGVSTTLVRNDDFWGDKPLLDKLIFTVIGDETSAYESWLNGEADYLYSLPAENTFDLDDDPDYRVFISLYQNRTYLTFNFDDPDVSKVEVRQAFAKAIDREGIFARLGGGGALAEYFISPLQTLYLDTQYKMPDRDVEGAKALLEQAGYTPDANGFYLHLTLVGFESGNWSDMVQVVKENVKEAGIDLEVKMLDYGAWSDQVKVNKDFQVTMLAGYQGPDVSGVAGRVQTNGGTNLGGYSNPEVDAALAASNIESDTAKRAEYLSIVQKCMSEDMPMVFLLENGDHYPIRQDIVGTPYDVPELAASSEMTYTAFSAEKP